MTPSKGTVAVCSDSLSSFQILKSRKKSPYNKIEHCIENSIPTLRSNKDWKIHLVWIPSYVRIEENEVVNVTLNIAQLFNISIFPMKKPEI